MGNSSTSFYDIHGLVTVGITGANKPEGIVIDNTLQEFKTSGEAPDLSIVLGEFPSKDWLPRGSSVGDRLIYDFDTNSTVVFRKATSSSLVKNEVEYIIEGDVRSDKSSIVVYVPHLTAKLSYWKSVGRGLGRRSLPRTVLATLGNRSFSTEEIELEAARLRLAILEPFLYYRLPFKGASLVHGSVVSSNGSGLMFAGSGHIGKTTLSLEMVKRGYSYLGDDLVLVNDKGQALPYAEPIRIQEQHLPIFPELTQRVSSRMGAVEKFFFNELLKSSPGEVLSLMPRLPISEIVEGAQVGGACKLDTIVLIRKGGVDAPVLGEIDAETLSGALAAELFWEFEAGQWRHNQYMYCASCAKGSDFLSEEAEHQRLTKKILADAVKSSKVFRLQLPYEYPIRDATKYIDEMLRR